MNSLANHSAGPQFAGYVYQLDRALFRLAANPMALGVGIEMLDDVVVCQSDGGFICEQVKTTSTDGVEPLADRRRGLWRALATWAGAVAANDLDPSKSEFHLVTNGPLGNGLAHTLSLVQGDLGRAKAAVVELREYASSLPTSIRSLADELLNHTDALLVSVVRAICCYSKDDGTAVSALRHQVAAQLRLTGMAGADEIIDGLLGWLHNQVLSKIFAGEHPWVSTDSFNNQLHALLERNRRRRFRELPASQVLVTDDDRAANRSRLFVEQLSLIGAQDDELVDAVDDYIRFNRERLRLSHEGDIPDDEWIAFDDRLIDRWKPLFRPHQYAPETQCQTVGRQIYASIQSHREVLAGCETAEYYITRGAYHRLADALRVGWHPKFHEQLSLVAS